MTRTMGSRAALLLLMLVLVHGVYASTGSHRDKKEDRREEREEREWEERGGEEELFLLHDSKRVVETDAGEMRVVRSFGGRILERPMHIGFITMEPQSLFVPQYIDSSLILFVRRGQARVGLIYKDKLAERRLDMGDIYRIPAGSAFYLVNLAEGQRLHIVCSIDPSESLGFRTFQSFFIGGGTYPTSILGGFDMETLSISFNATEEEVRELLSGQNEGPIVHLGDAHAPRPSMWTKFLKMKEQDRLQHLKRIVEFQEEPAEAAGEEKTWSWRKLLKSVLGQDENKKKGETTGKSPDSYNIYGARPDFKNNYGWSIALHESDYPPLKHSGIGVYYVNLTAGSMMAPHVNPTATEYGIVLRGSGRVQIVYPNGTRALNARVSEGDVFWIPRYFPFCQIASRTGPFEFFGFTTSARKNRPQFLVGASSILRVMRGPEIAAAFGISEERARRIIEAQREAVILPSASAAPPDLEEKEAKFDVAKVLENFGSDMVMGFD